MTISEQNILIIKQIYSGINRYDIDAVLELMDADVIRIEPEGFPTSGTYRGQAEMQEHLLNGRGTWAEGTCEPGDFFTAGNKVVVTVHIKVRLKNSSGWIDERITDGFVIKHGRAVEFHSFATKQNALEWAGIEIQD